MSVSLSGSKDKAYVALSSTQQIVTFFCVGLISRLITLGNSILYSDEEFYFAAARAMNNGALPFVDVWDRKPIGLFLAYLGPAAAGWPRGILIYQFGALLFAVTTAWLIARISDRAGWRRGGTFAGVAYLVWITIAGGQGGQSPVLYNAFVALAALLVIGDHPPKGRRIRAIAAMLLLGLALQIKYTVVLEGIFFGLWCLHAEWTHDRHLRRVAKYGLLLSSVALLPTLCVMAYFVMRGELQPFLFANFLSIFNRKADPASEQVVNVAKAAAILGPLIFLGFRGFLITTRDGAGSKTFIWCWLAVSLIAFALVPPWTDHYTLPVMLPGSIAAASFYAREGERRTAVGFVVAAALAGQASLAVDRMRRGTPSEFEGLIKSIGRGPGCLYVYSSSSMLYPATGRCAVSRYVFPSHLTRKRERGAIGVDQMAELRKIFAAGPAVVVMAPPYVGERLDIRDAALEALRRDYRLADARPLGRKVIRIYRRIQASRPALPISRFD